MSNRHKIYRKGHIDGNFVGYRDQVSNSPAWRQMSFGARLLYLELLRQVSFRRWNNGKVYLATRKAADIMGTSYRHMPKWFNELQHYGFIVMVEPGTVGPHGKAAKWRITDIGWGELDGKSIRPTKDYLEWDGTLPEKPKISMWTKSRRPVDKKSTKGNRPKPTPYVDKKSTKENRFNRDKKSTYLDITISTAVKQPRKLPWSTPQITEVFEPSPLLRLVQMCRAETIH